MVWARVEGTKVTRNGQITDVSAGRLNVECEKNGVWDDFMILTSVTAKVGLTFPEMGRCRGGG